MGYLAREDIDRTGIVRQVGSGYPGMSGPGQVFTLILRSYHDGVAIYRDIDLSVYTEMPEYLRNLMGIPDGADAPPEAAAEPEAVEAQEPVAEEQDLEKI